MSICFSASQVTGKPQGGIETGPGRGGVYESGFTVRLKVKLLYWITFWDLYNKLEAWCEVRMPRRSTEYRIGDRKTFSPWKGAVNLVDHTGCV